MIEVDVRCATIIVRGETYRLSSKLGIKGFGLKFDRRRNEWQGRLSLKVLEFLKDQGAMMTPEAENALSEFYRAAMIRELYYAQRIPVVA